MAVPIDETLVIRVAIRTTIWRKSNTIVKSESQSGDPFYYEQDYSVKRDLKYD